MDAILGWSVLLVIIFIAIFNWMISRKNTVNASFASIDAMLTKRYDLIPNLVSVCEKHMGYEHSVLKEITELRTKFMHATGDDRIKLEGELARQLKTVFAVSERYPDLRAAESFNNLMRSLNEVEEQISASRRAYNAAVMDYNNLCEMFPTNMVAGIMRFKKRIMFEATEEARAPVKVWR